MVRDNLETNCTLYENEGENINKGSLKNYKDFEALFYLQSIKLACHTFRAEDTKLLGQRQRTLLLTATAVARESAFLCQLLKSHFPYGDAKKVLLQKRSPEFKEHESINTSVLYSDRRYISIFQGFLLYKHPSKLSLEQGGASTLLTRNAEM